MGVLYRSVAVHPGFLANLAILTAAFVGLFAWISGAPVVMQSAVYGLSPFAFGVTFAVGATGFVLGTLLAARIFKATGAAGLSDELPFGGILADLMAGRAHISNQYEYVGTSFGGTLFGLPGKDMML